MKRVLCFFLFCSPAFAEAQKQAELKTAPVMPRYNNRELVEKYTPVLEEMVKKLEEKLSIDFGKTRPTLEFGLPRFEWEGQPYNILAWYVSANRKITVFANPTSGCRESVYCQTDEKVRGVLAHELMHFFVYRHAKERLKSSWIHGRSPGLCDRRIRVDFGECLVIEGIAVYAEKLIFPHLGVVENDYPWTLRTSFLDVERLLSVYLYEYSYSLVAPIIRKYGLKGIEYLLLNKLEIRFPKEGDKPMNLRAVLEYRERALRELAAQGRVK